MCWNDAIERKKFDEQIKRNTVVDKKLGMNEEQIKKINELDKNEYNSNRKFYTHNQSIVCVNSECEDESKDPYVMMYPESFKYYDKYFNEEKFGWYYEIEDQHLLYALDTLSEYEMELISLHLMEGYSKKELYTEILHVSKNKLLIDYQNTLNKLRVEYLKHKKMEEMEEINNINLTAIQQEVPDLYRWGMNCEKG